MEGLLGRNNNNKRNSKEVAVVDGREIKELVENKEAFNSFVEHKFRELDLDCDGQLSVGELQPAVADIGAALGLPAQGSSPKSDHIYTEVLNEFTHGKPEKVSKTEFREVLSDILLGMAAGLKRDPIVILRIDGEDLQEFVDRPGFESEAVAIFSQVESENAPLSKCLMEGVKQLTVEHGMPPSSDPWVVSNIIEPATQELFSNQPDNIPTQETFLAEFKKLLAIIRKQLQEHPVIVAHTENNFDGSGVKRLLANKFELDKLLDSAWKEVPKDKHNKTSKEYLRLSLDKIAASADLPPYGAIDEMDEVMNEAFKLVSIDDGKAIDETEYKKLLKEILASIMLQLQGNAIFVSSNSVVHEPLTSASTLLNVPPISVSPTE
ncbi:Calcium-binding EF-hand family protein [Rhynchospora pubera]|uniref:Calcium-binding EF-hand family protein n=1 Tax=Rhynchospora pubera TaxID=906938 RepID=A0AAV8GTI0_9POAL|nr:Calcium-binding EF-hand family protein [Rhynchospora pubera]KAJ4807186.1 Calcium-binding EF-hand family protein [Rhynchospora pubera]